jgi:hypothetical protein
MKQEKDEMFSFAAFDPHTIAENLRSFSQNAAAQSQEAFARLKDKAQDKAGETAKTAEQTMQNAHAETVAFGLQAIEAMRSNAELSFSHAQTLMSVTSMSQFIELQTAFIHRQTQAAVDQAHSMQDAAIKWAEKVSTPATAAAAPGDKPE